LFRDFSLGEIGMKTKLLAGILMLALVSGAVFAQDEDGSPQVKIGKGTLTLGAKIVTGVEATWGDGIIAPNENSHGKSEYEEGGTVRMYNENDDTRLRVEFSPDYINGNVGFRMRFRTDDAWVNGSRGGGSNVAAIGVRYAFGWIDLFDAHFRATGGYLDVNSNVWGTLGDLDEDVAGVGLRLEVKPIDGLNFGVFFRLPNSDARDNVAKLNGPHIPVRTNFEEFLYSTAFGLGYKHDLFYIRLQYLLDDKIEKEGVLWADNKTQGLFDFGAGLTAISQLELHVSGRIQNIENNNDKESAGRNIDVHERAIWTISDDFPLFFGLNARQQLDQGQEGKAGENLYMIFKPKVGYKLPIGNGLTVSLEGGYGFQEDVIDSLISVKPKIEYDFGKGFSTRLWYRFETMKKTGKDTVNGNTIQLDITWSL
jgi:hypothetical protein